MYNPFMSERDTWKVQADCVQSSKRKLDMDYFAINVQEVHLHMHLAKVDISLNLFPKVWNS